MLKIVTFLKEMSRPPDKFCDRLSPTSGVALAQDYPGLEFIKASWKTIGRENRLFWGKIPKIGL
jgi:hypothetical protein